jgi:hypothetical protein
VSRPAFPGPRAARLVALLALAALPGCAALAPVPPASAPPPRAEPRSAGSTPPAAAPVVTEATLEAAPSDSLAPVPSDTTGPPGSGAAADSGAAEVPVPAPTVPLGGRPEGFARAGLPDSLLHTTLPTSAPATAPGAMVAAPPPSASAAPPPPAHCWRVQFAAPAARAKAESRMAAAQSLLLVRVAIERAGGLYKVRSRDCLEKSAAERLRDRARASGFTGAFCFEREKP